MKYFLVTLLVMFLVVGSGCDDEAVDEYAMITFMMGNVKMNNTPVEIGDIIKEKDTIVTEADSFCDVKIGGSIIRVKEKTSVVISDLIRKGNGEDTTIDLAKGKLLCKPKKLLKNDKFIVKTPTAVAGVRGTHFTVQADKFKTTQIKVYSGKVKVAKRIKQFEKSLDKVLEVAPVLEKGKKAIITEDEIDKAEETAEKLLKNKDVKEVGQVINQMKGKVAVTNKNVQKFKLSDFVKDRKEIIDIKPKEPVVIKKIARAVRQEKRKPGPDGRLLVTRYEIYFIKNGKVIWEGKVVKRPIEYNGRLYVASGDYVFCATSDGPVLWRKNIKNEGRLEIENSKLKVYSRGKAKRLDPLTGQKL